MIKKAWPRQWRELFAFVGRCVTEAAMIAAESLK
jgi:hypothetical protein